MAQRHIPPGTFYRISMIDYRLVARNICILSRCFAFLHSPARIRESTGEVNRLRRLQRYPVASTFGTLCTCMYDSRVCTVYGLQLFEWNGSKQTASSHGLHTDCIDFTDGYVSRGRLSVAKKSWHTWRAIAPQISRRSRELLQR